MKRFLLFILFLAFIQGRLCAQVSYDFPLNDETLEIEACDVIILYDNGGAEDNYAPSSGTVTVSAPGALYFTVSFTAFDLADDFFASLQIYDGDNTMGASIANFGSGFEPNLNTVVVSSTSNVISFVFNSFEFNQIVGEGFEIEVTPVVADGVEDVFFVADSPVSCNGSVSFTDYSCNAPDSWLWNFGDGTTSTAQNPTHTYTTEGNYTVTLTACQEDVCGSYSMPFAFDSEASFCFQEIMPVSGEATTQSCKGTLLDPGGSEPYPFEPVSSIYVIDPPGATIQFQFTDVDLEGIVDFGFGLQGAGIRVYKGVGIANPVFTEIPASGIPPLNTAFVAEDAITVEFVSYNGNFGSYEGFAMEWEVLAESAPPVAAFSTAQSSPFAFNTPIQFNDESSNNPGEWLWNFGDGTISTEQNPQHAYTGVGDFTVTLVSTNCEGSSNTFSQVVTILPSPTLLSYSPASFFVTLESGETTTETLTINAGGGGLLSYDIQGADESFAGVISVLVYNWGGFSADDEKQYQNTIHILQDNFGTLNYTETSTQNANELEALLANTQILLVPGREDDINEDVFEDFQEVLLAFVENGGSVIFTGDSSGDAIRKSGLLDGNAGAYLFNPLILTENNEHPLLQDVNTSFYGKSGVIPYNFTNNDIQNVLNFQSTPLVSYREAGAGKVVYLSFNYYFYNDDMEQILANAISWTAGNEQTQWLFVNPETGNINANSSQQIELLFDATGKPAGTYSVTLQIYTNDPANPVIQVPCILVIIGMPQISVSNNSLDFGNVIQYTSATEEFTIYNTGSDTLFVTGITIGDNQFTTDVDDFYLYPGFSYTIDVTFAPTEIFTHNNVPLIIENNDEPITVYLNANATGAPVSSVSPAAINYTLNVGETGSTTLTLNNPGAGYLEYDISANLVSANTGFILNFTTDNYPTEFYWQLFDSEGNLLAESIPGNYTDVLTDYTESLMGLSSGENYTLELWDSFGDGGLASYEVLDATTMEVVDSGTFAPSDGDSGFEGTKLTVDLGSPTLNPSDLWVTFSPTQGELDFPTGSQEVVINFDATNLLGGIYETTLVIASNDPLTPTISIPVTLTVIGIPQINVSQNTLDFGSILVGLENTLTFTVSNEGGTDDLVISSIQIGNTQYEISPSNLTLDPNETATITVTFSPNNVGDWDTQMILVNNSQDGNITVNLQGAGQPAPSASVSATDGINIVLQAGQSGTESFVVANTGAGNLEFDMPANNPTYLDFSTQGGNVAPNGQSTVTLAFDATGMTAGVYDYVLVISTNDPLNPTINVPVTLQVIAFPQASFNANNTDVCGTDITVQFTDQSVNVPTSWLWNFGDGTTSTTQNPTHVYTENGTYTVTLIASNELGADTLILQNYIEVDLYCIDKPIPWNGSQNVQGCNGSLYDSGGAGGNYANNSNGTLSVTALGATAMVLTFTQFNYEAGFDTLYVYEGTQAIPSALVGAYSGTSLPAGGTITITGPSFTLREKTDDAASFAGFKLNFACQQPEAPPTAAFTATPTAVCSGLVVFNNQSTLASTYSWNFGDGSTSSNPAPTHQYTESGTYTVTLTVTNSFGDATATETLNLNVLYPNVGICEAGKPNVPIQFKDNTANATYWLWDFGDGTLLPGVQNATHTYTAAGTYAVTLSISNTNVAANCLVQYSANIVISNAAPDECTYVGIDDPVPAIGDLNVYPNPTKNHLFVQWNNGADKNCTIAIYDMLGKSVLQQSVENTGAITEQLDISHLAAGSYVLIVRNEHQFVKRHFVVE